MQVAEYLDGYIGQVVRENGFEDVVVYACGRSGLRANTMSGVRLTFGENHSAATRTIRECGSNGRRVIGSTVRGRVFGRDGTGLANSRVLCKDSGGAQANRKK